MGKKPKPQTPNVHPWSRRPWPTAGESNIDVVHAQVGRALSQWERFEFILSLLFAAFVSDGKGLAARRAYVAVRTFEGRAVMLRAAATAFFDEHPHPQMQELFKSVVDRAQEFSARRNDIAHGQVDHYYPEDFSREPADPPRWALYPSQASFKDRSLADRPSYCMTYKELEYFYEQFFMLGRSAMQVAEAVRKFRKMRSLRSLGSVLYDRAPPLKSDR
jgi:hypothetical protein